MIDMYDELIVDLTVALEAVLDTYSTGHKLPACIIVGVLHMIAYETMVAASEDSED